MESVVFEITAYPHTVALPKKSIFGTSSTKAKAELLMSKDNNAPPAGCVVVNETFTKTIYVPKSILLKRINVVFFVAGIFFVITVVLLYTLPNFKFCNEKERAEALSHFYAEINLPCFNKVSIVTFCVYVPAYPPIPFAAAICLRCAIDESTPIALNDCVMELLPLYAG